MSLVSLILPSVASMSVADWLKGETGELLLGSFSCSFKSEANGDEEEEQEDVDVNTSEDEAKPFFPRR